MNNGINCFSNQLQKTFYYSVLNVKFDPTKNKYLKEGLYTGKFSILAKGWHLENFTEQINLEFAINFKNSNFF